MGHYYNHDQEPCHQVPNASRPGQMRDTNVGDARKLNLCPSSTGIVGMANAPGLNYWKEGQLLDAGWETSMDYITREVWKSRCRDIAAEELNKTSEIGTFIHSCMEAIALTRPLPTDPYGYPEDMFQSMYEWWNESGLWTIYAEKPFCHPLGFGGSMDLFARHEESGRDVVCDYKSKDTKGKPLSRLIQRGSMPIQLASYLEGIKYVLSLDGMYVENPLLKTVIISRDEPGRIEEYDWPEEEYGLYWEEFKHRLGLWIYENKYDPKWEG